MMTTPLRRFVPLSLQLCSDAIIAFAATALFNLAGPWR